MSPSDQLSGIKPCSKIILKSFSYMDVIESIEQLICSFKISSTPGLLLFFRFLTGFKISSFVIGLFISIFIFSKHLG